MQAVETSFRTTSNQYSAELSQMKGSLATLVAQGAAQRAAEQAAAANSTGTDGQPAFDLSKIPPASRAAGTAVAYAEAQLGKAYCYAGTGPSCFDCSGLTMMAWGAAGVGLPHFSGAQYADLPHIL